MAKKTPRIIELKEMLEKWRSTWIVRATRTYKHIETDPEAFARGYNAGLTDVIEKIESNNF